MLFKKEKKEKAEIKSEVHPSKEEYENNVLYDQKKERNSGRYEAIISFLNMIDDSLHKDKEEYLFFLVGNYEDDHIDEITNGYLYTKEKRLDKYKLLKSFIEKLSDKECEENYFLFLARTFFYRAKKDCEYYILDYFCNCELGDKEYDLSKEMKILIPSTISLSIPHKYYNPKVYSISYDPILDSDNICFYIKFNHIVSSIQKMFTDIYDLELWYQLSLVKDKCYKINFVSPYINDKNKSIVISIDNVEIENIKKNYQIDDSTIKILDNYFGITFEEIINLSDDDLQNFLNENIKKLRKSC